MLFLSREKNARYTSVILVFITSSNKRREVMPKMKERGIYLATAVFPNLSLVYFAMAIYTCTLG
jgi:hypothetical protein